MKPSNFFKKLTEKINNLEPEVKKSLFSKINLETLKKISEYCNEEKKVIVIKESEIRLEFYKIISYFNLSVYYTRRGWAVFLTNFNGQKFTKFKDDRYRFLERRYPNSNELKELRKKRNKFFQEVMK